MQSNQEGSSNYKKRRKLLALGGVGLAAGVVGYMGAARTFFGARVIPTNSATRPTETSLEPTLVSPTVSNVTQELFLPHVGSPFTISHSKHPGLACILKEVSEVTTSGNDKARFTSFSLLFEAPPSFLDESDLCTLNHPDLGKMEMFLVRIGNPKKVTRLEAIFSSRVA